ncbi:hypothetical protein OEZ85_010287 [Tetradesmus obliquus]|uniref:Ubiquitin-like domain-containing protein n=1 Tax=Tetradesmus obliquus TaxID=3088 RepID=A0ABY8TM58_TETOB|nr:hypothetical protein OEZ85_010287 [Tetradesmus obliquus]
MEDQSAGEVTFVIRNPSKHDSESFRLSVPAGASVADIQNIIHETYDGKPSPSTQTLIYAGKVLKDTTLLVKDLVKPMDCGAPHSLHLVMLVFGMVLYQHCTWPRLCILLAGSVILYATALWAPFRQFIVSLAMPPRPEQLAEMQLRRQQAAQQHRQQQQQQQQGPAAAPAGEAAAGGQQQQQQEGGAGAPAAAAAAAPAGEAGAAAAAGAPVPAAPGAAVGAHGVPLQPGLPAWLQQGIVREVLAVLLSFVTSLLPGWNYNAEDAAVFAAAQELVAREQQQQQQQGGGNAGAAAGGAAAGGAPAGDVVNAAA